MRSSFDVLCERQEARLYVPRVFRGQVVLVKKLLLLRAEPVKTRID